jgi:hypothetical protein
MEALEIKRMSEAVEAGLRDGRSLGSLKSAMVGSGYSEEDIQKVIQGVDRRRTVRRAQRKKRIDPGWAAAAIILMASLLAIFFLLMQPAAPAPPDTSIPGINDTEHQFTTCYVIDEKTKDFMVEAGAQCDRWILIKEI